VADAPCDADGDDEEAAEDEDDDGVPLDEEDEDGECDEVGEAGTVAVLPAASVVVSVIGYNAAVRPGQLR
jgi:hypothetical protein